MKTETKFIGRVAYNHRVGWVVIWNDDYKSAMPDEATAKQCALAPEMFDALSEMLARMDDDNWDAEKSIREKVRAILSKLTCK